MVLSLEMALMGTLRCSMFLKPLKMVSCLTLNTSPTLRRGSGIAGLLLPTLRELLLRGHGLVIPCLPRRGDLPVTRKHTSGLWTTA